MNDQLNNVLDVAGGNRPLQVNLDTKDVLQLALAVCGGMLAALILFEGVKALVK